MVNVAELMNLKDYARFVTLKPRLLKCTILAMENMGTNQKNDGLTKGDIFKPLPQLRTKCHGEDITA